MGSPTEQVLARQLNPRLNPRKLDFWGDVSSDSEDEDHLSAWATYDELGRNTTEQERRQSKEPWIRIRNRKGKRMGEPLWEPEPMVYENHFAALARGGVKFEHREHARRRDAEGLLQLWRDTP